MLFPRKIQKNIDKWLFEKEIIILNGPRQVGKTSLLKLIKEQLIEQNISNENIFYLNLEEIDVLDDLNKSPENILNYIINKENKNYFLIDEIQYLDNPSNFLKHLYDKYVDELKIIVTGSSALELKAQLQDSLVGRKVSFMVNPLCFEEFLQFKQVDYLKYLNKKEIPIEIKNKFDKDLEEYLIYGGMPAVVLQSNIEMKEKMLREYVNTYINKDIRYIGRIDNISQFNAVIKILASQIGKLLNIAELSNTSDVVRRHVEKYIELLEHTFVLSKINSFHNNVRKQIVKMPKIYFFDLGLRNAILNNFLATENRQDGGDLFENFVFLELKNNIKNEIFFYRTISKSEIDFVVDNSKTISLIEVKYKRLKRKIDSRVLKGFKMANNKKKRMFVVSLNQLNRIDDVDYVDYRNVSDIS